MEPGAEIRGDGGCGGAVVFQNAGLSERGFRTGVFPGDCGVDRRPGKSVQDRSDRAGSLGEPGPNQYLITGTGSGSPLEELGAYARIEFTKMDSETGRIIADNAQFSVYEWNGGGYEKSDVAVNREGDKYISDDLFRTDEE